MTKPAEPMCSECGEVATKHAETCWLGPKVKPQEPAEPEYAFPGFALLRGPPLTAERIEAATADADRGWNDEHVPESLRPRYRSMVAVCGRNSAENWLSFRVDESGNLRE